MAMIQVKDGFHGWKKVKPANLTRLAFKDLQANTVIQGAYIQGMLVTKWSVHKYKNSKLLKVVIQEVISDDPIPKLGNEKLQVFVIGDEVVERWDNIAVGDYVCMNEVSVELGPNDGCRIALEETAARQPKVWVLRKDKFVPTPHTQNQQKAQAAALPKTIQTTHRYFYTPLADLQPVTTINVYGVITFARAPTRSKGSDYSSCVCLTDTSLRGSDARITFLLFAREEDQLPVIRNVGQIVRLHRIRMNLFNNKLQGRSGPGYSWLLFDATGASNTPVGASTPQYSFGDEDTDKLRELRQWVQSDSCPVVLPKDRVTMSDCPSDSTVELDIPGSPAIREHLSPLRARRAAPDPLPSTSNALNQLVDVDSIKMPSPTKMPPPTKASSPRKLLHQKLPSRQLQPPQDIPASINITDLKDLRHNSEGVCVVGVIVFIKPASKTSKGEYSQMVSIVDASVRQSEKLKCLLFSDRRDFLLNDAIVGQMACFYNLNITKYGGAFQAQRGRFFHWALFDCMPSTPAKKIIASKRDYVLDNETKRKLESTRVWAEQNELLLYQRVQPLSDVEPDQYFDHVCQIVSTGVLEQNVCMLLRVWDGTKAIVPFHEKDTNTANVDMQEDPDLMARARGFIYDVFVFDDHFATAACLKPGDYVLFTNLHSMRHKELGDQERNPAELPRIELALHGGTSYSRGLRLLDSSIDMIATTLKDSLYEKFRSTNILTDEEQCEDESLAPTNRPTSNESQQRAGPSTVKKARNTNNSNVVSGPSKARRTPTRDWNAPSQGPVKASGVSSNNDSSGNPRCLQQTVTVTLGHHHISISSLKAVVEHSVPYKFRVRVQLVGYEPDKVSSDIFSLQCPMCGHYEDLKPDLECPVCKDNVELFPEEMKKVLNLMLYLADNTGWIQAFLIGDEAEKFLGLKIESNSTTDEVFRTLDTLYPSLDKDSPRWMECCILSYNTHNQICFQIFDTTIAYQDESL